MSDYSVKEYKELLVSVIKQAGLDIQIKLVKKSRAEDNLIDYYGLITAYRFFKGGAIDIYLKASGLELTGDYFRNKFEKELRDVKKNWKKYKKRAIRNYNLQRNSHKKRMKEKYNRVQRLTNT